MFALESASQTGGGHYRRIPYIDKWREYLFYNKAIVFYWTELAFSRSDQCGPTVLGVFWNTWFEALGREPQMQLDEFFVVPVSVR
jgi:hypothetical protein